MKHQRNSFFFFSKETLKPSWTTWTHTQLPLPLSWCKSLLPLDLNSFPKRDKRTLTVTQTYRKHVDFELSFPFFIIYSITQTQEKHHFPPSSKAMGRKHENCTLSHLGDAGSGPAVGLTQLAWSTHWHWPGMCVGHWDFRFPWESKAQRHLRSTDLVQCFSF